MYSTNSSIKWKIAACLVGVLMIAGAIIYSLTNKQGTTTAGSSATDANQIQAGNTVKTATANNAPIVIEGEPGWVQTLQSKYETNEFVFVVIPGTDDLTQQAEQAVQSAITKIRQTGTTIDSISIDTQDPELKLTAERLAIQKLPAVLLYTATGSNTVIKGDINDSKLLEAYLSLCKTCEPDGTCAPGKSSCCP